MTTALVHALYMAPQSALDLVSHPALIFAQRADGATGTRLQTCNLIAPSPPVALGPPDFDDQAELDAAFARGVVDAQRGAVPAPAGIPMT